jgi:ATP-dependent Clp protease ATP-binding subunit ClpA
MDEESCAYVMSRNMLKPSLARGDIQLICATTLDEYRMHIEKDPSLTRIMRMRITQRHQSQHYQGRMERNSNNQIKKCYKHL